MTYKLPECIAMQFYWFPVGNMLKRGLRWLPYGVEENVARTLVLWSNRMSTGHWTIFCWRLRGYP